MRVLICPPLGLDPAVVRTDGRRELWGMASLLAGAIDCEDGLPLDARWLVWVCGEAAMSVDSLRALATGTRHQNSHAGMG